MEGIKQEFLEEIEYASPEGMAKQEQYAVASSESREVFVVHGSDHGARDNVARFLGQLGLVPIILDEQSSKGRTIHQKFRDHATVEYAVVLFTPDDVGGPVDQPDQMKPRARQNVVYELGFFSAALGDDRVCVLYSDGVEIPSDLSGVVYVSLDSNEAWKFNLAREMNAVGIEIDMNRILG